MKEDIVAMYDRVENQDPNLTSPAMIEIVERRQAKRRAAAALIIDEQPRDPKGESNGRCRTTA